MLGLLAKAVLSPAEAALVTTVAGHVAKAKEGGRYSSIAERLGSEALPSVIKQLQGTEKLSPLLRDILAIVQQADSKGYLPTLVSMGVEAAAAKGYDPEVLASLTIKVARALRIKVKIPAGAAPDAAIAAVVSKIAEAHAEESYGIGGVSICPNCNFAHLI